MIKENKKQILLNFVGDIMLGDSFHMLGIGVGSSIRHNKTKSIFEKAAPVLRQADINIGNLECAFLNEELNSKAKLKPYLMYSVSDVECLKEAGFHILCLANNHTMQYGKDVFNFTEQHLNNNGIRTVGTARHPYQNIIIDGIKVAFLNYSLRPNQYQYSDIQYIEGNREKILEEVYSLSSQNDHVIVLLHWGDEYINYPNRDQIELAHEIIDSGAKLIIGHHPHILQGIEYYNKGVIAYSIGNFVFDKPQRLQRKSIILQAALSKKELEKIDLVPVYINKNYQPEIAKGEKKENIEKTISKASKKITTGGYVQSKYNRDLLIGSQLMQMQFYFYFMLNFYRYPPMTFLSLFLGAVKRKILQSNA